MDQPPKRNKLTISTTELINLPSTTMFFVVGSFEAELDWTSLKIDDLKKTCNNIIQVHMNIHLPKKMLMRIHTHTG